MYDRNEQDRNEQDMQNFLNKLWKNRELMGVKEIGELKIYNFPYVELAKIKNLPDKIKYHIEKHDGGMMVVLQSPAKRLYYVMMDDYK